MLGASILEAPLEHTAPIWVGGQIKDRVTEGPHKCQPLANDALQHLLYDMVTIGVAHAAQYMAVELTHERSLLIREEALDSLKESQLRCKMQSKVNETRRGRNQGVIGTGRA